MVLIRSLSTTKFKKETMSKYEGALTVLERSRDEILRELESCGSAGGVGRAASYAPQLVSVMNAIACIKAIPADTVDRMAAVRAAKKQ